MSGMLNLRLGVVLIFVALGNACGPAAASDPQKQPTDPGDSHQSGTPPELALHTVSPASGPKTGGITVRLTGEGFSSQAIVSIGGTEASNVVVFSGTLLTATLPPWLGDWSSVPVVVRNPDASQVSRSDLFSYYTTEVSFPEAHLKLPGPSGLIATGDFNRDMKLDLIAQVGNDRRVLLGDGMGGWSLGAPTTIPFGDEMVVAKVNSDLYDDVLVVSGDSVYVALGDGSGGFGPAVPYSFGAASRSLRTADVNGDGKLDCVVVNRTAYSIRVLLGDGAGGFSAPVITGTSLDPDYIIVADFNRDGFPDLAMSYWWGYSWAEILLGNGSGGFSRYGSYSPENGASSMVSSDWNGDGKPDLVVATAYYGNAELRLGDGRGGFVMARQLDFGVAQQLFAGDWNGDGKQDLAALQGAQVQLLPGDGTGGFGASTWLSLGDTSPSVVFGDFNGDAKVDVAAAHGANSLLSFHAGDGAGSFHSDLVFVGRDPQAVVAADFNGDGNQDLAVADGAGRGVSVRLGDGKGNLGPRRYFAISSNWARWLFADDWNHDGKLDLIVGTVDGSSYLFVLLGDGLGGFASTIDFPPAAQLKNLTVGDINGDGWPDVIAERIYNQGVSVELSDGTGAYTRSYFEYLFGTSHIADCNRDGKKDIIVVGQYVTVLISDGMGGFTPRYDFSLVPQPGMRLADFNQDGNLDLLGERQLLLGNEMCGYTSQPFNLGTLQSPLIGDWNGDHYPDLADLTVLPTGVVTLTLRLNTRTGDFGLAYPLASYGKPMAAADFNGDGKNDLVIIGGGAQILLNQSR